MYFFKYIGHMIVYFNLLVICSISAINHRNVKEQEFSDVLKNITLANKILQDLLNNYKRLEMIYQPEEFLQNDSSLEIDKTFQNSFSSKQNINQRDRAYEKLTTKSSLYVGTALIYDNESIDKKSGDTKENKEFSENSNEQLYPEKISYKEIITNNSGKTKIQSEESLSDDKDSDEVEEINIEMPKIPSNEMLNESNESKGIVKSDPNNSLKSTLGKKTRFSIQYSIPNKIYKKINTPLMIKNNARRLKRVIYSETFSPDKIWQELINRPITLKKDSVIVLKKNNDPNCCSKSNEKLITENNNWKRGLTKSEFNMKEQLLHLDLLKTILRNTYGEACLQMPLKKCKRAIKTVNKTVCKRRFKCKSNFKTDFTENAKIGCNKEFSYREETVNSTIYNNKKNVEKFSPPEFRDTKKNGFPHIPRSQFEILSQYTLRKDFISLRNKTPQDDLLRIILRDKYEKRCQKESSKKCINACNFALNETCSAHTCKKKQKQALKSECKNQCKKMYITDSNKTSSESSDESDSGSD